MSADELLDEDAFNPKKLFNEEEYSTLIINREGFSKQENNLADLVESLLESKNTRAEDEAIFTRLKELNAQDTLVKAIAATSHPDFKIKLLAACWECGLEFAAHFMFFIPMVCDANFQIAMEALTVIEHEEGAIAKEAVQEALSYTQKHPSPHVALQEGLTNHLHLLRKA